MTRILHLSDTHVSATGVDADGALDRMLYDARQVPDLDLAVVGGDIADHGSAAGCATVRDRVGAFAAERSAPHLCSTGNHDSRKGFREALGSGHLASDGGDCGELLDPAVDTRAVITYLGDLRIITLDSLMTGQTTVALTIVSSAGSRAS